MRWRNDNARRLYRILGSGIQKGKQVDVEVGQERGSTWQGRMRSTQSERMIETLGFFFLIAQVGQDE